MRRVVVVADMKIGEKPDVLVTHALGSCLGLMIYEPVVGVGGLHARPGADSAAKALMAMCYVT